MDGRKILQDPATAESVTASLGVRVSHGELALRAATDADMDFLRDVFSSTRMQEFMSAGMSLEQAETLLASQFSIQHDYYHRHYPQGRFEIIVHGERDVGRLYHDWSGDVVQLIDIALLPVYRGAGIGTRLMRAIVAEATQKHRPMQLFVEFNNPVRALYRRLGFVPTGENGIYERMHRGAMPFDDEGARMSVSGLSHHFQ